MRIADSPRTQTLNPKSSSRRLALGIEKESLDCDFLREATGLIGEGLSGSVGLGVAVWSNLVMSSLVYFGLV